MTPDKLRDEIIEILADEHSFGPLSVMAAIDRADAILALMPHWISVEDKEPEEEKYYYFISKDRGMDYGEYFKPDNYWLGQPDHFGCKESYRDVTHYIDVYELLPPSPTEKE